MTNYGAIYAKASRENAPGIGRDNFDAGVAAVVAAARADLMEELGANETRHRVMFSADEFILEHPLMERVEGTLTTCEYHAMVASQSVPPATGLGSYWLTRDGRDGSPQLELIEAERASRPSTPDVKTEFGKRVTVKRCCNGCNRALGDATDAELHAALTGARLPDTRDECGCAE